MHAGTGILAVESCATGLAALTYLTQGWLSGLEGFSTTPSVALVGAEVLNAVWMTWLLAVAWRMPERRPPHFDRERQERW